VTDGTAAGTHLLKDIDPRGATVSREIGPGYSPLIYPVPGPSDLTYVGNGRVMFAGAGGLWMTDGTTDGTVLVAPVGASKFAGFGDDGGPLFISGDDNVDFNFLNEAQKAYIATAGSFAALFTGFELGGKDTITLPISPSVGGIAFGAPDLKLGANATLILRRTDETAVTATLAFAGGNESVTIDAPTTAPTHTLTLANFRPGDVIEFSGQKDLTVGYVFQNDLQTNSPARLTVYRSRDLVANVRVNNSLVEAENVAAVRRIYPLDDGLLGTRLVMEDPKSDVASPDATNIDWSFIHMMEGGNWSSPYLTIGGGVTIGSGSDLGRGPLSNLTNFLSVLTEWNTDPNLRTLTGGVPFATVLGRTGAAARLALEMAGPSATSLGGPVLGVIPRSAPIPWQAPGGRGNPTRVSVSLTEGQLSRVNQVTEKVEYEQLVENYNALSGREFSALAPN